MIYRQALFYSILRENYKHSHYKKEADHKSQDLNKAAIIRDLHQIPENSVVKIDGSCSTYIDRDVVETIHDFERTAKEKNIQLELIDIRFKRR